MRLGRRGIPCLTIRLCSMATVWSAAVKILCQAHGTDNLTRMFAHLRDVQPLLSPADALLFMLETLTR